MSWIISGSKQETLSVVARLGWTLHKNAVVFSVHCFGQHERELCKNGFDRYLKHPEIRIDHCEEFHDFFRKSSHILERTPTRLPHRSDSQFRQRSIEGFFSSFTVSPYDRSDIVLLLTCAPRRSVVLQFFWHVDTRPISPFLFFFNSTFYVCIIIVIFYLMYLIH